MDRMDPHSVTKRSYALCSGEQFHSVVLLMAIRLMNNAESSPLFLLSPFTSQRTTPTPDAPPPGLELPPMDYEDGLNPEALINGLENCESREPPLTLTLTPNP